MNFESWKKNIKSVMVINGSISQLIEENEYKNER